jgi:hypothetical protein
MLEIIKVTQTQPVQVRESYMTVQHSYKPKRGNRRQTSTPQKWSPPSVEDVLANMDAALFEDAWPWVMCSATNEETNLMRRACRRFRDLHPLN